MQFGSKSSCFRGLLLSVLVAVVLIMVNSHAFADMAADPNVYDLTVRVGDTTADAGDQNTVVSVFLTNVFDSVSAFELWLQLSRPDVAIFQTDLDTVVDTTFWTCEEYVGEDCVDSISCNPDSTTCDWSNIDTLEVFVGNFDTVGTLTSGWEYITSRSIGQEGYDIKVTAVADRYSTPGVHPGIPPQSGGVLFRLQADVYNVPDTMDDRTVSIFVPPFLDNFNMSRPDGTSIGILTQEVPDSNYYHCTAWVHPEEICLSWEQVTASEDWDSVYVDVDTVGVLDTTAIKLDDGSLTVNLYTGACCDSAGVCYVTSQGECEAYGGTYKGNDVACSPTACLTCCIPPTMGDLDQSGQEVPYNVDGIDLSIMLDGLFISLDWTGVCLDEADLNYSGQPEPTSFDIDGIDLSIMLNALFISLDPPDACP